MISARWRLFFLSYRWNSLWFWSRSNSELADDGSWWSTETGSRAFLPERASCLLWYKIYTKNTRKTIFKFLKRHKDTGDRVQASCFFWCQAWILNIWQVPSFRALTMPSHSTLPLLSSASKSARPDVLVDYQEFWKCQNLWRNPACISSPLVPFTPEAICWNLM